jgi:hypothetical protein
MENSQDNENADLQHRLNVALARNDDKEVRNLLAAIGKAELNANNSAKRLLPVPCEIEGSP